MEEVDNIIIESLRNINCNLDTEIRTLKLFSPEDIAAAITACLTVISPGLNLGKKMPIAMSARLNFAMQLVDHVKSMGFKGDLGYQSILYSNEIEIRRVLMYLIERLPRESSKDTVVDTIGYVPCLVNAIEQKVRSALQTPWIPSTLLQDGITPMQNSQLKLSFGSSIPLKTKRLEIPNTQNATEEEKLYWVHCLPNVTKQCTKTELIPSLIIDSINIASNQNLKSYTLNSSEEIQDDEIVAVIEEPIVKMDVGEAGETKTSVENENIVEKTRSLRETINEQKRTCKQLEEETKTAEEKLKQLKLHKESLDINVKDSLSSLKIKSRTLTVLSKDDNIDKLKSLIDNGNERLLELANQWQAVQTPLLDQYRSLQATISEHDLQIHGRQQQLKQNVDKLEQLKEDLQAKEQLERKLAEEYQKVIENNNNRSNYTKRIMEIIDNIKRQDKDIANVLKDAKNLQKELKIMSGQLDRSFTMSDALIFKDAKHDEVARKAYKFLVAIHMDCETIIQAVNEAGAVERECRNIQDQIDVEIAKDTASKLKQILLDIKELGACNILEN